MASYSVRIKKSAAKELDAVEPLALRSRVVAKIRALGDNPRPVECEKLAGEHERYRVRQGAYRIVYSIDDESHVVTIVKVGHRREVYR